MLLKTSIRLVSKRGGVQRLSIFVFHRVHETPDPLFPSEIDIATFDRMLGWVGAWFRVLPLDVAIERMRQGRLPSGSAALTFDDGYADNLTRALPVLQRHEMNATLFVATHFIDGGRMWNDSVIESIRGTRKSILPLSDIGLGDVVVRTTDEKRAALARLIPAIKHLPPTERTAAVNLVADISDTHLPDDLMMSSTQLKAWRDAGQGIGAHTVNHPILSKTPLDVARNEITGSRDRLEALLDQPVRLFAYPNGRPGQDYLPEHVRLVSEAGFDAAVSTTWGAASRESGLFELPRFTPWDRTRFRFGGRLLQNLLQS